MKVQFLSEDAGPVDINVSSLDTKFGVVKEKIREQIGIDNFTIKKIIANDKNIQYLEKIDLNENIGFYMDPEMTYSFTIIKQIPLWIYSGKIKMYQFFDHNDTFENILNYAFGIKFDKNSFNSSLMSNDFKKLKLKEDYLKTQICEFQDQQIPLHLYIKSKIPNQQLYFKKHKKQKQQNKMKQQQQQKNQQQIQENEMQKQIQISESKMQQQFQKQNKQQIQNQELIIQEEQGVEKEQNVLHYFVKIKRVIDQEKICQNQQYLLQQSILLMKTLQNFIKQLENFKNKLEQNRKQFDEAKQKEEENLFKKQYQKKNSSQNLSQESQFQQFQNIFEQTTQEVNSQINHLNQQSQKEQFFASFPQRIVNETQDQKINTITQQDFKVHEILLQKFTSFLNENQTLTNQIVNYNYEEKIEDLKKVFEELNQSPNQNFQSSQQIYNSEEIQSTQSQNIQDSVVLTQVSQNNPFYNQFQDQ